MFIFVYYNSLGNKAILFFMRKKILITGGAGFIGSNITELALNKGYEVVCFDNLSRKGVKENILVFSYNYNWSFVNGDVKNLSALNKLSKKITAVFALAANPSVPKSIADPFFDFENNTLGHLNTLLFARDRNIPVIFASSSKIFSNKVNLIPIKELKKRYSFTGKYSKGIPESFDINGFEGFTHSPYGVSKLAAEKYTREFTYYYGLKTVINRMGCVYGPYQKGAEDQGWLDWFLRAKLAKKEITFFGNGKQVRDLIFGVDIAELFLYQLENIDRLSGKTFNVGGGINSGFNTSLIEAVELIDRVVGGPKTKITFEDERFGDQKVIILDNSLVIKETGWQPTTTIEQGLKIMLQKYQKLAI
jgi:CDP-paratose 2-epimerase